MNKEEGTLSATFVPKWKPNTAYLAGDAVVSPSGGLVTAKATFTSSAAYSAANWNSASIVGQTRAAEGTQTNGENVILGSFGYIATGGATNSVSGGSPSYENVIGGNPANVSTATSNLTGAPTLVAPDGNWNSIWGGYDNVVNGWANQVQGYHCKIHTGANHATIGGGSVHEVIANSAYGTIGGGTGNKVSASQATVSGGSTNNASGNSSSIGGGITNAASGAGATIGGGTGNTSSASNTTVGGGASNQATNTAATVAGGASNQAGNINATVAGGSTNIASGNGSTISGGLTNTASGTSSTVNGGRENTASGEYSTASGYKAVAAGYGSRARASGMFAAAGDAQELDWTLRAATTDGAGKFLQPTGVSFLPALPDNTTWAFELTVAARSDTGESAAYKVTGAIDRGTGAATTALVGTPTVTVLAEDAAAWNITAGAGTGDGSLRFTVTGEAAKNIRWVGRLNVTQVSW
ncbi:hypothetical protein [Pseudarthrobacter oxydans]|uniref:hypothetical protein n=1 Tax=Pseudarthrobacter oxydans TaxID=1671 RepID=UPI003811BD16